MIIPPLALAIGVVVVAVRLLISEHVDRSAEEEMTAKAERTESQYSQFASNCRFRSEKVPYRDLSSTPKESTESTPNTPDQGELPPGNTDDPNQLIPTDKGPVDQSKIEAETSEDTDI